MKKKKKFLLNSLDINIEVLYSVKPNYNVKSKRKAKIYIHTHIMKTIHIYRDNKIVKPLYQSTYLLSFPL